MSRLKTYTGFDYRTKKDISVTSKEVKEELAHCPYHSVVRSKEDGNKDLLLFTADRRIYMEVYAWP